MEYKLIQESFGRAIDNDFAYRMLSRLQMDCKFYLGQGQRDASYALWAKDEKRHIALMRELYAFVPEKPEWLSLEDIDEFEKAMVGCQP